MQLPLPANSKIHIGLFRLSALGDLVLVSAVIPMLRKAFPNAQISLITSKLGLAMLEGISGAKLIVIPKPKNLTDFNVARRILKAYKFDLLLCMQASMTAHLLYPFINARLKLGFDNHRAKDGHRFFVHQQIAKANEHLADGFARFVSTLTGCDAIKPVWQLPVSDADHQWAQDTLTPDKRWVALVLATSKAERDWPIERYIELINSLAVAYPELNYVLLGGNSANEREKAKTLTTRVTAPVLNLTAQTTPKQLAAVLSRCACLLSGDTGPVHISVAMGTPVVALYAVARPELCGPYYYRQFVINAYPQAVQQLAQTHYRSAGWHQRVHHAGAMQLITVDQVKTICLKVLQSGNDNTLASD